MRQKLKGDGLRFSPYIYTAMEKVTVSQVQQEYSHNIKDRFILHNLELELNPTEVQGRL